MKNEKGSKAPNPETQDKDNHFVSQYKTVYQSFMKRPKTMLMVCVETGIMRENICRYVASMKEQEKIQVIRKGYDPHTGYIAEYYSTNGDLFTKSNVQQLNLFSNVI